WSATGVQQGDSLGPLIFALILHPLLHKVKDSWKSLLHAWYLNDGTVIRDSEEVSKVLDVIKVSGHGLGLKLNIKKTMIFWPSCNGMKLRKSLFPVNIRRPSLGVKLPGGAISRDTDFISGLAMRRAANVVDLMGLLPYEMVKDMEVHFDMNMRQKIVFKCLRAPRAHDFLLPIPIDGLGQHMSPVEYCTILKYRFMIPLFPVDTICSVCHKACLDSFGELAIHCKELSGFKYRHDLVRDVLSDICRHAGISIKKEAPVNFLTDPSDERSTLRPADVLAFGWVGGKYMCVDLTRVSPLVGLSSKGFTAGQATLKAAPGKVTKHKKTCIENQHVFIPFAFDTFGFLAPEAVELLSRVQRVMHSNVLTPRSTDVVFKRIGFAIQKGLAAWLVLACLPPLCKSSYT
nr:putative reverse transcriptase domain-containing protein [Tanacetum cinerariifolium]